MALSLKEGEYLGSYLKTYENAFLKLSTTIYDPHRKIERHYHSNDYISILIKGNYLEKNTYTIPIEAGSILYRPAFYSHENLFANEGGVCFNIELKSGWEEWCELKLDLPKQFKKYRPGSFPSLYQLLVNFQSELSEDTVLELIYNWAFSSSQLPVPQSDHPWLIKVKGILENELDIFHSLQSLSERSFVHPTYLARAFKLKTGMTIGEYQLKAKLSNALSLLLNSSLSISDISFQNGFYDDAHFIRAFKSLYKISPHRFRLTLKS